MYRLIFKHAGNVLSSFIVESVTMALNSAVWPETLVWLAVPLKHRSVAGLYHVYALVCPHPRRGLSFQSDAEIKHARRGRHQPPLLEPLDLLFGKEFPTVERFGKRRQIPRRGYDAAVRAHFRHITRQPAPPCPVIIRDGARVGCIAIDVCIVKSERLEDSPRIDGVKALIGHGFDGDNELANPTIVVVTDCNDLDNQLFDTFVSGAAVLRQQPEQAGC
jgi:hypothetical protein